MEKVDKTLAITAAEKYLTIVKDASIDSWMEIWADDASVEFPYAPSPYPRQLKGKNAIYQYYKNIAPTLALLEEHLPVTYPSSDPLVVVFEVSMKFRILSTGKDYAQDYIGVVKVRADGRIVLYREYWDPIRALEALHHDNGKVMSQ